MINHDHDAPTENMSIAVAFTDDDDETGMTPAHPAATVVIFHEAEDGPGARAQLLMVRRAATMAFAAGAAVFPGGRVDPDDHVIAQSLIDGGDLEIADAAARVAAIRETLEETGLVIGMDARAIAVADALRRALLEGAVFSALLRDHGLSLQLDALTPFTRWRPNFAHARTFDTRFFIARMTGERPALDVHEHENSALFWIDAASAVEQAEAGALHVIFPTRRNLERLAQYNSFAEAAASTQHFPPRRITPWIETRDGTPHLCIRDDCGYPVTSEPMESAARG